MAGLDQALSGLAWGQLQAIVVAAQSKLQAVPTTGLTSASAAVDVAVHDTKILFPPVFPMLPDMSNGRFPHSDCALARAQPGFGWLTDITARYLFKRTLYIWKPKQAGATPCGWTSVRPDGTQPLPATNSRRLDGGVSTPQRHPAQQHNTPSRHTGEQEPGGPGHRTRKTSHRAGAPVNRSQEAQDTAHAKQHTERAHR